MSDDLVKWLRDFADDGYADLSIAAADRIEELEAQIRTDALQYLADVGQMGDTIDDLTRRHERALHKIDVLEDLVVELEDKLEKVELCPSCREPLSLPSGDGCAAMTKHLDSKGEKE
jgi:hypothetical protein